MDDLINETEREIGELTADLLQRQQADGSWRFCFENGTVMDAQVIILLRILNLTDHALVRPLHDRILAAQQPSGGWVLYPDEADNVSASVDAYYALLCSGLSRKSDEPLLRAKRYIQTKGGLGKATSTLTRTLLAATGQCGWPHSLTSIPLEAVLLPASFLISLYDFSGYARIHLVPMLILADRRFVRKPPGMPDLSDLNTSRLPEPETPPSSRFREMLKHIQAGLRRLIGAPHAIHAAAVAKAEQFILQRIESDGSLYSYASSTVPMVFALLALGYETHHPLIQHAVEALAQMRCRAESGGTTIQNSPSAIWDTALLTYALQAAGMPRDHEALRKAGAYLLTHQQSRLGDWAVHNPYTEAGGWGFTQTNTMNPDVDDTTAALRAIRGLTAGDHSYRQAWNRGLQWVMSMQNPDGGWPAFEKNTDKTMLTWLAIDGAKAAAIDPSGADLTGRTLEYLGNFTGLDKRHPLIQRGVKWLIAHQEQDGSWYGRWGICYIYGTWAALTGLRAAGVPEDHEAIRRGVRWLLSIQRSDGGWGESCRSDRLLRYVPLEVSTPSQTSWALDALIVAHSQPIPAISRGIRRLFALLNEAPPRHAYPTGAGLPGHFYVHYHSYRYIWPLLALSHYKAKFESADISP